MNLRHGGSTTDEQGAMRPKGVGARLVREPQGGQWLGIYNKNGPFFPKSISAYYPVIKHVINVDTMRILKGESLSFGY